MNARSLSGAAGILLLAGSVAWAADGAAVFKTQCAKCHGDTGQSDTAAGKAMKVPALAGDAKLGKMSEADIATAIKGSAKHPSGIKGLNADDLNAVAGYVRELASGK